MDVGLVSACRSAVVVAWNRCRTFVGTDLARIVAYHGPGRLVGVSIATVALFIGLWWLVRPVSPPVESLLPRTVTSVGSNVDSPVAQEPLSINGRRATLRVHVAGAVRRPGVYTLPGDARVIDAVKSAGGPTAAADLDRINLAQSLVDAEQVFVPRRGSIRTATTVAPRHRPRRTSTSTVASVSPVPDQTLPASGLPVVPPSDHGGTAKVNLNTATVDQLDALSGIGPATARAIVSYRTRKGPFAKIDDLLNIDGIGPKKLAAIRPHVEL